MKDNLTLRAQVAINNERRNALDPVTLLATEEILFIVPKRQTATGPLVPEPRSTKGGYTWMAEHRILHQNMCPLSMQGIFVGELNEGQKHKGI